MFVWWISNGHGHCPKTLFKEPEQDDQVLSGRTKEVMQEMPKIPILGRNIYIYIYIWVNYSDLTATSLEIMVNKGNHPQMALIQVSEIL